MNPQNEATLEENLIKQLQSLDYERVYIKDEKELLENLKKQLEIHNKTTLSQAEFQRVLNHLNKGDIFDKAETLRGKYALLKDDNKTTIYIEFLDSINWCQNIFQVTSQVTIEGKYKNRYDVTLLINGLPLVQIELKRRGLELKEAFNQINRYQRHSYSFNSALFSYIQIFVISNGVNTKYYSNNKKQSFKQTFFWADESNNNITELSQFTKQFLEKCHISKMICRYIVLAQVPKILMVLRPYQFWAVEAIINRVKNTNKNGYIWHTTGSGKTLTSFKASQILTNFSEVEKVVFVVDRKDLDSQTTKEFNSFSSGSVDGTDNTKTLVKQFLGVYKNKKGELKDSKLIITTIQKLNNAINNQRYLKDMQNLKDKKIVFIFDECHRSQFGEAHKNIVKFFTNAQLMGFTGTPIFEDNALGNKFGKRTTAELFGDRLHKYIITNAIKDENVLKFSVEYVGRYKKKDSANEIDIEVEGIDTKELFESNDRIEKIVDYILTNHDRKTHSKEFNSIFAVSSVEVLCKYYEAFKKKNQDLKIATIFSYSANEDDKDANGIYALDESDILIDETNINQHSRDKLEEYISDYNKLFDTNYTTKDTKSFYNYYDDISRRTKKKEIDILLVVNMFLTGFDAPSLNTLYVDKNLKYHGLIQAFSRTNRILNEKKSQGNIVCFRNLKNATDEAIALFSNQENVDKVLMESYEYYVQKFNEIFIRLLQIAPSVSSVDSIIDENIQLEFIKTFREMIRVKNILEGFSDFKWFDLSMSEQQFEDYKSKYLDLYDKIKRENSSNDKKVSILKDVDFELELIHKDEINVSYILKLLAKYSQAKVKDKNKQKENINNLINSNPILRSKKELIEEFINTTLSGIDIENIEDEFFRFIDIKKEKSFNILCKEENLNIDKAKELIENYLYDSRKPLSDDIVDILLVKPKLLERKKVIPRVLDKIVEFVDKFYNFN
ncbi:MAG TPA: type I restriction endonuclease subunit R [Aliarcobacter thereius]|uniref:Type I restriction enzyme endonuclease subunit n=1 Tax=Aliarcobacter thereius TaxID=544718 RepID=A0A5R9H3S0_9BACT|nr:type I restriction endonuclease subunit R [Aliarcobacter thereius]TLS73381.1 type I restriction endonuclease subunit R [Aliarcobacter thereius]HJE03035.1 type I restriction endonuclease subunit R [Aliarcobacter thereius]